MVSLNDVKVEITVDNNQFKRKMRESGSVAKQQSTVIKNAIRAAVSVAAIRQVVKYADSWKSLQNRLRLVTGATQNLNAVTEKLYRIAQDTRSDLASTVTLYQRVTFATRDMGVAQEEVLKFTEQLNKQLIVGGLSATEASVSVFQLTQAFNKGKLDGDEFRTILESAPPILEALQAGLKKTKGEILDMSAAGELGASELINAINDMSEVTDQRFSELPITVDQALTKLENSFQKVMGSDGPIASYVQNLAYGLEGIVQIIDDIGDGLDYLGRELSGENDFIRKAKEGGFATEATILGQHEQGTEIDKALREAGLPGIQPKPKPQRTKASGSKSRSGALKKENELLRRQKQILQEIRTPLEEYNLKIEEARVLLDEKLITDDEFVKYQEKMKEKLDETGDAAVINAKIIKDSLGDALEEALFDFDNFGDSVTNILEGIARDLMRQQFIDPFTDSLKGALGGGGSGGGILDGVLGDIGSFLGFSSGNNYVQKDMVAKLHQGEMVMTKASVDAMRGGAGGGSQSVIINNYSQSQVTAREQHGSRGKELIVQIDEATAKNMLDPNSNTNSAFNALASRTLTKR